MVSKPTLGHIILIGRDSEVRKGGELARGDELGILVRPVGERSSEFGSCFEEYRFEWMGRGRGFKKGFERDL